MAPRSAQDQARALLERRVAEARVSGALSSDVEAAVLLETVGLSLITRPKVALVFAEMARNGLLAAVAKERTAVATLRGTVGDLMNPTFAIKDVDSLQRARVALLQMSSGQAPSSQSLARFSQAVDEFLSKSLAKNVRRAGSTSLARPGAEASQDLLADFQALADAHEKVLDRLYSLSVGVRNFQRSSLGSIFSTNTVTQARRDLEAVLAELRQDDSGLNSRDFAVRLIADKAALTILEGTLAVDTPLLTARAMTAAAVAQVAVAGPFSLAEGGSLTVADASGTETVGPLGFAHRAFVVGTAVGETVEVPANHYLFVQLTQPGGMSSMLVPINSGAGSVQLTRAELCSRLTDAGLGAEFLADRLVLSSLDAEQISVAGSHAQESSGSTVNSLEVYTNSAHSQLGLEVGQTGVRGQVPAAVLASMLSLTRATTAASAGSLVLTGVDDTPAAVLRFSGSWATDMGLPAESYPSTAEVLFVDDRGAPLAPPAHAGDVVAVGGARSSIVRVFGNRVTLAQPIAPFDGSATILSGLSLWWSEAEVALRRFLGSWLAGPFAKGLDNIDRVLTALMGSSHRSHLREADRLLADLDVGLAGIEQALPTTAAATSGREEREVAQGIIDTLIERKFDRALDTLLRCRIQELFEMDWQTASYGGNMMKAAADFARTDVVFPDYARDEGYAVEGRRSR